VHLDYVLSCRVIAAERRRVLARALHEGLAVRALGTVSPPVGRPAAPAERVAAVTRLEIERARFRAHASALHARLVTSRLFESAELTTIRARLFDAVAAIDAAAGRAVLAGRMR
jgi:hypothetical protein